MPGLQLSSAVCSPQARVRQARQAAGTVGTEPVGTEPVGTEPVGTEPVGGVHVLSVATDVHSLILAVGIRRYSRRCACRSSQQPPFASLDHAK